MNGSPVLQTLADLVRINSVNPAYPQGRPEREIQEYVRDFFRQRGIATCCQEVAPGRPNVIAWVPGRTRRRLVFEGHTDTVGIEGMTVAPFEPTVRDGRLYGRGTCDAKAGLAALMHALADVHASGPLPPCEVWLAAAADEEHAYRGVLKLLEGLEAAAAVVAEPTSLRPVVASKGCLRWRVVLHGRAAHSSKPDLGSNAIIAMARLLVALEADADRLRAVRHELVGSPTLSVGRIQGGTQTNIVPECCWVEIDRRLIPGENPKGVLSYYCDFFERHRDPRVQIAIEPLLIDWPLETARDAPIVTATAHVLGKHGLDGTPVGVVFGSDASKFAQAGIPSLVLGPGSIDQAHTAEEFVEVEQVERAMAVYRDLMYWFE